MHGERQKLVVLESSWRNIAIMLIHNVVIRFVTVWVALYFFVLYAEPVKSCRSGRVRAEGGE